MAQIMARTQLKVQSMAKKTAKKGTSVTKKVRIRVNMIFPGSSTVAPPVASIHALSGEGSCRPSAAIEHIDATSTGA
jgi:hypothetical protein